MLWLKALHIISMVCWFSGIFYLPRLFVYHAMATDTISHECFKVMERKLYYGIMTPAAILTLGLGLYLLSYNFSGYIQSGWMQIKLALVVLLMVYHGYCGYLRKIFLQDKNTHSHVFYRWLNEIPVILLIAIILLVVVKPF